MQEPRGEVPPMGTEEHSMEISDDEPIESPVMQAEEPRGDIVMQDDEEVPIIPQCLDRTHQLIHNINQVNHDAGSGQGRGTQIPARVPNGETLPQYIQYPRRDAPLPPPNDRNLLPNGHMTPPNAEYISPDPSTRPTREGEYVSPYWPVDAPNGDAFELYLRHHNQTAQRPGNNQHIERASGIGQGDDHQQGNASPAFARLIDQMQGQQHEREGQYRSPYEAVPNPTPAVAGLIDRMWNRQQEREGQYRSPYPRQ